jgi:hypothetical protein
MNLLPLASLNPLEKLSAPVIRSLISEAELEKYFSD